MLLNHLPSFPSNEYVHQWLQDLSQVSYRPGHDDDETDNILYAGSGKRNDRSVFHTIISCNPNP